MALRQSRALKSGLLDADVSEQSSTQLDVSSEYRVGLDSVEVEKLVRRYLQELSRGKDVDDIAMTEAGLGVFTTPELGNSLRQYVEKDSRDAIHSVIESVVTKTVKHLRRQQCPEGRILPDILAFRKSRLGPSSLCESEIAGDIPPDAIHDDESGKEVDLRDGDTVIDASILGRFGSWREGFHYKYC